MGGTTKEGIKVRMVRFLVVMRARVRFTKVSSQRSDAIVKRRFPPSTVT
jgi:hypothetical protein